MSTPGELRPGGTPLEPLAAPAEQIFPHPEEQVEFWCNQLSQLADGFPPDGECYQAVQETQTMLRGWVQGIYDLTLDGLEAAIKHAKEHLPQYEASLVCLDRPEQLAGGLQLPFEATPTTDMLCSPHHTKNESEIQESYQEHYQAATQAYRGGVSTLINGIAGVLQDPGNNAAVCDMVQRRIMANHSPQPVDRGRFAAALADMLGYKNSGRLQTNHADPEAYIAGYLRSTLQEILVYERSQTYGVDTKTMVMDAWLERKLLPTVQDIQVVVRTMYEQHMVHGLGERLCNQRDLWIQERTVAIYTAPQPSEDKPEAAELSGEQQELLRQLEAEDERKINPLEQDHLRVHNKTYDTTYIVPLENHENQQDIIAGVRALEALSKREVGDEISHRQLAAEVWQNMTIAERSLFIGNEDPSRLLETSGRYVQWQVLDSMWTLTSFLGITRERTNLDFRQTSALQVHYGGKPIPPDDLKEQGLRLVFPPETPKEVITNYRSGKVSKESIKTAQALIHLSQASEQPSDVSQEDALAYLDFVTSSEGRRAIHAVLASSSPEKPQLEERLAIIRRQIIKPTLREGYFTAWCNQTIRGPHTSIQQGRARQTGGELDARTTGWFVGRPEGQGITR